MPVFTFGPTTVETAAACEMELAFLRAIADDHGDDLAKFAYADWLDERGDDRGRFLREFTRAAKDPFATLPAGEEFEMTWRHATGVYAREAIRQSVRYGDWEGDSSYVERLEPKLMATARPILYMSVTPVDDAELPAGCTKWGGRPDLPVGSAWPRERDGDGIFCAQVRLSDLRNTVAGRELPGEGLLSFFKSGGGWTYLNPESAPTERPVPPYYAEEPERYFYPLAAGKVRFVELLDVGLGVVFDLADEDFKAVWEASHKNFEDPDGWLIPDELGLGYGVGLRHLLGWGSALSTGAIDAEEGRRRLASFGSDGNEYWGDGGLPSWHVSPEELRAGRLDRAECFCG